MKYRRLSAAFALVTLLCSAAANSAEEADNKNAWRENYAYTLGVQAYNFAFPWVFLSTLQYQWVVVPPKNPALSPNMATCSPTMRSR